MERVTLTHSGIEISRLGFGCAGLTGVGTHDDAVRLLETAFERGVTHFDAARMYGMGHAEGIVGRFLDGKRDRVTVATKFGMLPKGGALGKNKKLVGVVKSAIKRSSVLNKIVRRGMATAGTGSSPTGRFSPEDARSSLETSLRELGTDRVDMLLLHNCEFEHTQREELIAWLEDRVREGTVRAFGPSTTHDRLPEDLARLEAAHTQVQFGSNAANRHIEKFTNRDGRDVITFAPVYGLGKYVERAKQAGADISPLAERAGVDPTNASDLVGALLHDALHRNPAGGVLFATTKPARVGQNIDNAFRERTDDQREALCALLDRLESAEAVAS